MDGSNMPFMCDSSLGSSCYADTALRLNSHSDVAPITNDSGANKRKWNDGSLVLKNEISLALELGSSGFETSTQSAAAGSVLTCGMNVEDQPPTGICLDFNLSLGSKRACKEVRNTSSILGAPEKETPNIDLELSLSTYGATESDVTSVTLASSHTQNGVEIPTSSDVVQLVDEGSTSSKWKRGPLLPTSDGVQTSEVSMPLKAHANNVNPPSVVSNLPSVGVQPAKSLDVASSSHSKPPRRGRTSVKTCQFPGCEKGARGASGRCISHGGGRRCQRPGCQKGAEGRTAFCKAHGGGRRCEHLGCTKSAEGRTNFCIAHGGGRRCSFADGCTRAARGKSGLCIRHGGGKRCKVENCTKSAEGLSGLCIAHGGGRRCQFPQCTKGAQGSTKFCKAHGGGKRCTFLGCTKGAEGSTQFCKGHGGGKRCSFQGGGVCSKSVHGGTLFCVSHGGGKRCAVPECTKSARGRTDYCVRHGGGKRCKFEGCGKSAQGSTDFCKAHGGGKRCLWGQPGSGFGGDGEDPCDKFARGKLGLCAAHSAQVQDKRVHGDGTVGLKMKEIMTGNSLEYSNNTLSEEHVSVWNGFNLAGHGNDATPMQSVLPGDELFVGHSVGSSASASGSLPEGRVHGGSLMAMLRGGDQTGWWSVGS